MLSKLFFKINQDGFTLIELMIVIAIIGILAAIALPSFAYYRMRSFNASAQSDIRNLVTCEAALFSEWSRYGVSEVAAPGAGSGGTGPGALLAGPSDSTNAIITTTAQGAPRDLLVGLGNGVNLVATTDGVADASFTGIAKHLLGNTAYGADSNTSAIYQDPTTWPRGIAIVAGNEPASTANDDFNGVGNWTTQ